MSRIVCVTGRFQPVHHQHLDLFEIALQDADVLIVAVTNPDSGARHEEATSAHRHLPESNPFTYYERARMLQVALEGARMSTRATIVPFDLTRPDCWPDYVPLQARHFIRAYSSWERDKAARIARAGYPVTVLDGDPDARLSASDIRAHLHEPVERWAHLVPDPVVPLVAELLTRGKPSTAQPAGRPWAGVRT